MPIENNLIKATNRIAQAIEDKVAQINVAPVDVEAIVEAINNLQIGGGGTGGSGSIDCNCLAIALKPIVQAIVDLRKDIVCVVAPIAAGVEQIKKELAYWTEDGPHLGIDAPPGSFIFPKPNDIAPPLPYTPDTTTQIDPITGAWLTPPIVEGVTYVAPPGGMQGETNSGAYNDYKCDMATYIVRYHRAWFEVIDKVPELFGGVDLVYGAIEAVVGAIQYILSTPAGPRQIYSATRGVIMTKGAAETTGVVILSVPVMVLLSLVLVSVGVLLYTINALTNEYNAILDTRRADLKCALYKAKSVAEARGNFMAVLTEKNVQISFWYNKVSEYILSDALLGHLFACSPDFDPNSIAGLGSLEGGCVSCILCKDMDVTIPVNLKSKADVNNNPFYAGEGLLPYPLTYPINLTNVLALCAVLSTDYMGNSAGSDRPTCNISIYKNGVFVSNASAKVAAYGGKFELLMPCPVVGYFDKTPIPFNGTYELKITCQGSVGNKPRFTLETVSYKEKEPEP